MKAMTMTAIAAVTLLSACGGSGGGGTTGGGLIPNPDVPFVPGTVTENADSGFTIVQDGETTVLPASRFVLNGQRAWSTDFNGGTDRANSFISDDVTAIGGVSGAGTAFSGITGSLGVAPTGDATFDGRYAVNTASSSNSGPLSLIYDLGANTLDSAAGSTFVVDGDVAATGAITGTVAFESETAEFEGGFYGDDDVAGAFNNDTIGGVFYGTN